MRAAADLAKIQAFMAALGAAAKAPGRIYLTGGATALLLGWRTSTVDVDLKGDPEPQGMFEAIAQLKDTLDVNIELASPDQFIPALPGWRERSQFIAAHGQVEFFHYDLYSQTLAKLQRGHERDFTDARAMLARGLVEPRRIRDLFAAIEPALIRFPGIDPVEFRVVVDQFCQSHSA
jgi:hypothetical protein